MHVSPPSHSLLFVGRTRRITQYTASGMRRNNFLGGFAAQKQHLVVFCLPRHLVVFCLLRLRYAQSVELLLIRLSLSQSRRWRRKKPRTEVRDSGSPCWVSAEKTIKYCFFKRCPTKCEQSKANRMSRSYATHDLDRRVAEPATTANFASFVVSGRRIANSQSVCAANTDC